MASGGSSETHLTGRPRASRVHPASGLSSLPGLCATALARLVATRESGLPAVRLVSPPTARARADAKGQRGARTSASALLGARSQWGNRSMTQCPELYRDEGVG